MKKSYRRKIREAVTARCRRMAKASNIVQAAARQEREPDEETIRRRVIADARGTVLLEGCTYYGDGRIVPWSIRRTVAGRNEQFDILAGPRVVKTINRRKIPADLRPALSA
jgi:hypothetical protein